jgi:hypothetical protein
MTVPQWIKGTADYMVAQRPDIYDYDRASAELIEHIEYLRTHYSELPLSSIMTGSFIMLRIVEDDGCEEFQVAQFVSSVTTFQPEEDCMVIGNTRLGVDLPPPSGWDDDDKFFFGES